MPLFDAYIMTDWSGGSSGTNLRADARTVPSSSPLSLSFPSGTKICAASATAWRPLVVDRQRVGGVIRRSRLRIDGRRAVEEPGGVRNFFMINEPSDLSHVRQRIGYEATTMHKLQISQYLTPKSV
jgi:hypothetical protein